MHIELNLNKTFGQNPSIIGKILKAELLRCFKLNLSEENEKYWNSYFKNNLSMNINCAKLFYYIISNLKFNLTSNNKCIVYIDNEVRVENIRVIDLVKLFNYGNLEVKGSKVISNSFNYLEKNIGKVLLKYFKVMI